MSEGLSVVFIDGKYGILPKKVNSTPSVNTKWNFLPFLGGYKRRKKMDNRDRMINWRFDVFEQLLGLLMEFHSDRLLIPAKSAKLLPKDMLFCFEISWGNQGGGGEIFEWSLCCIFGRKAERIKALASHSFQISIWSGSSSCTILMIGGQTNWLYWKIYSGISLNLRCKKGAVRSQKGASLIGIPDVPND